MNVLGKKEHLNSGKIPNFKFVGTTKVVLISGPPDDREFTQLCWMLPKEPDNPEDLDTLYFQTGQTQRRRVIAKLINALNLMLNITLTNQQTSIKGMHKDFVNKMCKLEIFDIQKMNI